MNGDDTRNIDDITPLPVAADDLSGEKLLLVYHKNGTELVSLSPESPVVIGRAPPSDIQIRDSRLSKQHARFELFEGAVWVEDLNSTNGTWVNDAKVKLAPLERDDIVTMGATRVFLHRMTSRASQLYGLADNDSFYSALEDEINRGRSFNRELALLMVRGAPGQENLLPRWCPRVRELLRPVDRIGLYGPDVLEILLPESGLQQARELADAIVSVVESSESPLLCGIAVFPQTGRSADELLDICRASLKQASPEQPAVVLGEEDAPALATLDRDEPVFRSPSMIELDAVVDRIAPSSIPVLIIGETGVGKEVIARAIHERGKRRDRPMRTINCGAIPEQLIESVMFGHERGAFTGADRRSTGVFEEADGGSVFLDEIGELSTRSQVALLRVLDTQRITRVGSNEEIEVNVRILAATHQNLPVMCRAGSFRQDLLFRLNTMVIKIPPLRERVEDIQPLAEHFCRLACEANNCGLRTLDEEALALLDSYYWPGNVRELRNAIERAVVVAQGRTITAEDLPARVQKPSVLSMPVRRTPGRRKKMKTTMEVPVVPFVELDGEPRDDPAAQEPESLNLKTQVQRYEIDLIRDALHRTMGNQSQAAQMLGISRHTLANKMKTFDIDRNQTDRPELPEGDTDKPSGGMDCPSLDLKSRVDRYELRLLRGALKQAGGNQGKAAELLGVPKHTVVNKIAKYRLR